MFLTTTSSGNPFDGIAAMLIVLGVVVIGALMTISIRTKIAARRSDRQSPRQRIEQLRRHAERTDDHDAASARFLDTTSQLMAQLDNKAERLEQLLTEAEQRIEQFQTVAGQADRVEQPTQQTTPIVEIPPRAAVDPLAESIFELADSGATPVEIAQQLDEQVGRVELILALRRSQQTV